MHGYSHVCVRLPLIVLAEGQIAVRMDEAAAATARKERGEDSDEYGVVSAFGRFVLAHMVGPLKGHTTGLLQSLGWGERSTPPKSGSPESMAPLAEAQTPGVMPSLPKFVTGPPLPAAPIRPLPRRINDSTYCVAPTYQVKFHSGLRKIGLGIETDASGKSVVSDVAPRSVAAKHGVSCGSAIVAINGKACDELTHEEVTRLLKEEKERHVVFTPPLCSPLAQAQGPTIRQADVLGERVSVHEIMTTLKRMQADLASLTRREEERAKREKFTRQEEERAKREKPVEVQHAEIPSSRPACASRDLPWHEEVINQLWSPDANRFLSRAAPAPEQRLHGHDLRPNALSA